MISVIVPYDTDRGFLEQCVRSIKMQSYSDFEIIQVHRPLPVAKNFNIGLKLAKGKFCKFVTEDDWLPVNSLQDLRDGIMGQDWICANAEQHENGSSYIYRPFYPQVVSFKENVKKNFIHGGTTLYRTEQLLEIGGMDETLWTGEEYEMHLRLMSKGYMPGYIDKEVYCHRLWSGQKSKLLRKNRKNERQKEIARIQSLYINEVQ